MEDLIRVFKALSDESRLKLLQLLPKPGEKPNFCVNDLTEQLNISQPCVSHHLGILKNAGLVRCEKSCGNSFYVVNVEKLESSVHMLREFTGTSISDMITSSASS